MMIALIIFLTGFGACLMISIPLVAWAVRLEDEENGIIKEKKERFRGMPKIVAAAAALSIFWFLSMPLYFLMLREKIREKKTKEGKRKNEDNIKISGGKK